MGQSLVADMVSSHLVQPSTEHLVKSVDSRIAKLQGSLVQIKLSFSAFGYSSLASFQSNSQQIRLKLLSLDFACSRPYQASWGNSIQMMLIMGRIISRDHSTKVYLAASWELAKVDPAVSTRSQNMVSQICIPQQENESPSIVCKLDLLNNPTLPMYGLPLVCSIILRRECSLSF